MLILSLAIVVAAEAPRACEQTARKDRQTVPDQVVPKTDSGAGEQRATGGSRSISSLALRFSDLAIETGYFTQDSIAANYQSYAHAVLSARFRMHANWDAVAGIRLENWTEYAGGRTSRTRADYAESFIRFRSAARRVTLGTQTLNWGTMDVEPPADKMARLDLSRIVIDDRFRQRRAVPAIRWEEFLNDYGLDIVILPVFTPSILPRQDGVWYPLNRERGRAIGFEPQPGFATLIRLGSIEDDHVPNGFGGAGFRIGQDDGGLDWHVTAQRARRSRPYFAIDPAIQALLPDQISLLDIVRARARTETFRVTYPWNNVAGGDLIWVQGNSSWRLEAAWSDGLPLTSRDFSLTRKTAFDWAVAWEYLTGPGLGRINLQLSGREVFNDENILDEYQKLSFSGDLDIYLARQRWRLRLRFLVGLEPRETMLNPEISRLTEKRGTFFVGFHKFSGRDGTVGGFFDRNNMLKAGWRTGF